MSTLEHLSPPGKHLAFHSMALATLLTGILMLLTAGQLGPVQMFVVPMGLYTVFAGLVAEIIFWIGYVIARLSAYFAKRKAQKMA